jgi:outer membrane protein assembly factor BamE (lipoprotein component of BamABCDE complex)|tara:strand:+ start:2334 stop:2780 length:447 start_codon:yes stop_codon:yes gene_type:complete
MKNFTIIISFTILMLSCTPPEPIIIEVPVEKKDNLSLGKVQSQIKKGMNQTEVLEVLGSPNIVTKNSNGDEVWTYDRIGTFQSSSNNASATIGQAQLGRGFWAFLFGGTTNSVQSNSDRNTESKSLTVIITYNESKVVSDFTYQSLKY